MKLSATHEPGLGMRLEESRFINWPQVCQSAAHGGKPQMAQGFSGIMSAAGRRITNPPDPGGTPTNLPHMAAHRKLGTGIIVAAREETKM